VIGVIDYGMGNLRSVLNALDSCGAETSLVREPADAQAMDKLILPGVGAFAAGMESLTRMGFADALPGLVGSGRPLLGICLGAQLIAERGTEHGDHRGLGLIGGEVRRIETDPDLRIPHVGWNSVTVKRPSALFAGLPEEPTFYFVHSYHLQPDAGAITATTDYGVAVTACVERDHVYGVQFHPEKSQADGLRLLRNFIHL
jgi:imidazole glycerol-phosphate synthase subunit HisH